MKGGRKWDSEKVTCVWVCVGGETKEYISFFELFRKRYQEILRKETHVCNTPRLRRFLLILSKFVSVWFAIFRYHSKIIWCIGYIACWSRKIFVPVVVSFFFIYISSYCLQFYFFQRNQYRWIFSCSRRLKAWPSLLTAAPRTFYLLEIQCVSTPWTVFTTQDRSGKPMFSPFVNFLFYKKIFLLKLHSSANFTQAPKIWWQTSL